MSKRKRGQKKNQQAAASASAAPAKKAKSQKLNEEVREDEVIETKLEKKPPKNCAKSDTQEADSDSVENVSNEEDDSEDQAIPGDVSDESSDEEDSEEDSDDEEDNMDMNAPKDFLGGESDSEEEEEEDEEVVESATKSKVEDKKKQKQKRAEPEGLGSKKKSKKNADKQKKKKKTKEGEDEDVVVVNFDFTDMKEEYFHSIKQLLQRGTIPFLPAEGSSSKKAKQTDEAINKFSLSDLVSLILDQVEVGTVLTAEGEDDSYGFVTALSLRHHKEHSAIREFLDYIKTKGESEDQMKLKKLLEDKSKHFGWLLNERMVNVPYQLVPIIHKAFEDDVQWSKENIKGEEGKAVAFDHFIVLTSSYREKAQASKKEGKQQSKAAAYANQSEYYYKFEDEMLEAESLLHIKFDDERGGVNSLEKQKHLFVISRKSYQKVIQSLQQQISSSSVN